MARVVLVTGPSRSGKSRFAQYLAESLPGERVFVATCPPLDAEMRRRIDRHRVERQDRGWHTVEEPTALARALGDAKDHAVVLVDCLTLWINNLMHRAEQRGRELDEDELAAHCRELHTACQEHPGTVVLVTNEVGWGIVPENPAARRFRDLAGRCNQQIAAWADQVSLVCCGVPLHLKGPIFAA